MVVRKTAKETFMSLLETGIHNAGFIITMKELIVHWEDWKEAMKSDCYDDAEDFLSDIICDYFHGA